MENKRLIIIGLDGATFDIIDPLLTEGKLPNIKHLIKSGVSSRLLSTIPYATIPAWPSFMTGMNPGKFGVFDFFKYDNGKRRVIGSHDIQAKTIWEMLSDHGKRSIVMNVPGTYPPQKIKGIVVSGMLTPEGEDFVHPKEVRQHLDEATGGYQINEDSSLPQDHRLLSELILIVAKQKTAFLSLLKQEKWDFGMIMFRGTDIVQHIFWEEPKIIYQFHQYMDLIIGEIVRAFPRATVVIMSDHGFQAQKKDFHINKWLIDNRLMTVKPGSLLETERWNEIGKIAGRENLAANIKSRSQRNRTQAILENLGFTKANLRCFVPNRIWSVAKKKLPEWIQEGIPSERNLKIDWSKTEASAFQQFTMETKAITINLQDRESQGIVKPSEYEDVRTQIIKGLSELQDPESSSPIVKKAWRKEELYSGPYLKKAPDIILDLNEGYNVTNVFVAKSYVTERKKPRGCHHREGILIAAGEEIAKGVELNKKNIFLWDLAPTILHYLGAPTPEDGDGRLIKEMFEKDSDVLKRSIIRTSIEVHKNEKTEQMTGSQQREIEERLRGLGYL